MFERWERRCEVRRRTKNLESLTIQDFNSGEGAIDSGMDILNGLPDLLRLELVGLPGMSRERLNGVWKTARLKSLRLNLSNHINEKPLDELLMRIKGLPELEHLSLRGTVSDAGLKNLAALGKLQSLDLRQVQGFSDGGLASLMESLPNLRQVKFSIRPELPQAKTRSRLRTTGRKSDGRQF